MNDRFPDLRTFVFVKTIGGAPQNFVLVDADSAVVRTGGGTGIPDTIYVFDHPRGTNLPSVTVRAPTCSNGTIQPGITVRPRRS